MRLRSLRIVLAAVALVAGLAASQASAQQSVPANRGPVPNECSAFGRPLQGLTETQARAAILESATLPGSPPVTFTAAGREFAFLPDRALEVDVERMLATAYEETTAVGFDIAPAFAIRSSAIAKFVNSVARTVGRPAVDAAYVVKAGRIRVKPPVYGRRLRAGSATRVVRSVVTSVAIPAEVTSAPIALPVDEVRPKVTEADLGTVVLVDLSERRLWLYGNGKLEKSYRVAIGMRSYPTPRGTFRVVRKARNPSWGNPGSAWAASMPAYIPPGPSNPLGTRALYLNVSGIRIHGTAKRWSIGTAASHGCVRMLREDVEELYPLVPVGTKVHIVR